MESVDGLVKTTTAARFSQTLKRLGTALLDLAYPPVCLACAAPVASADTLCPACFVQLRPITAPLCPVLGLPFAVSMGPDVISAEAMADPPPFGRRGGQARLELGGLSDADLRALFLSERTSR